MRVASRPAMRPLLASLCLLALACDVAAQARKAKPRVPPGRDPGGIAVAVVGGGINYLRPEIAARLARDGEGEPIAFDFEDGDNRPLERVAGQSSAGLTPETKGPATALAGLLLAEAGATRIVVTRDAPGDSASAARGLALVARTPARIVLLVSVPDDWAPVLSAQAYFKDLLVIVPATRATEGLAHRLAGSPGLDRANLLVVAATADEAKQSTDWTARDVDVAAPPLILKAESEPGKAPVLLFDGSVAAARIAALAARLVAVEPGLGGRVLKARVLSFARQAADPARHISAAGVIAEPQRIHRLE